jgi:hypothetical protein
MRLFNRNKNENIPDSGLIGENNMADELNGTTNATLVVESGIADETANNQSTQSGVDNGAVYDPRTRTGNPELDDLNSRILELIEQKDSINDELNKLTFERDKAAAGQTWAQKMETMSEADLLALQEAVAKRQSVGTNGIQSSEGVNGQNNGQ